MLILQGTVVSAYTIVEKATQYPKDPPSFAAADRRICRRLCI